MQLGAYVKVKGDTSMLLSPTYAPYCTYDADPALIPIKGDGSAYILRFDEIRN